jgi:hypothetical protein
MFFASPASPDASRESVSTSQKDKNPHPPSKFLISGILSQKGEGKQNPLIPSSHSPCTNSRLAIFAALGP